MSDGYDWPDPLADLIARLEKAATELDSMAEQRGHNAYETRRLNHKASGVRLALSYAREYHR